VDGTKITLMGLDEILAELYSEGRLVNPEAAEEIIERLEAKKNYIPSSEIARREYRHLLLEKYKEYMNARAVIGSSV
jgi:hypothetical protein